MTLEAQSNAATFAARRAFRDYYHRIRSESSAERLWNRHLTDKDHQRLLAAPECRILLSKLDCNDSRAPLTAVYRHYGTAGMWAMLKGVSLDRAVLEVAHRINFLAAADFQWLLREIGECDDPGDALKTAIAAGHLVLVESPRAAYWGGQAINIDWHRYNSLWDFFWELSLLAKSGRPIDRWAFAHNRAENIVSKRKHRLTALPEFPIGLADSIIPAGRGTQQLNLPREQIRLFELSDNGTLEEWRP